MLNSQCSVGCREHFHAILTRLTNSTDEGANYGSVLPIFIRPFVASKLRCPFSITNFAWNGLMPEMSTADSAARDAVWGPQTAQSTSGGKLNGLTLFREYNLAPNPNLVVKD
jgi:hypothetical protein